MERHLVYRDLTASSILACTSVSLAKGNPDFFSFFVVVAFSQCLKGTANKEASCAVSAEME